MQDSSDVSPISISPIGSIDDSAMDPEASKEMKAEALSRAKQHNLDIAAIARETVRLILEAAFVSAQRYPPSPILIEPQAEDVLDTSLPDVDIFAIGLSEEDVYLIRSIEWLSLVPDTKYDALERANEIIRHFLGELGCTEPLTTWDAHWV